MVPRSRLVVLLALSLASAAVVTAQPERPLLGRAVQGVIDELRAGGAPFVYSSNLLPSTLTVVAEPAAGDALAMAREILLPHGLAVREETGVWLVVRGEPPSDRSREERGSACRRAMAGRRSRASPCSWTRRADGPLSVPTAPPRSKALGPAVTRCW